MKVVFATNNKHKLDEVQKMLPSSIELITLRECGITEDIPENEPTLEGNAIAKARYLYEKLGCDCFADDTGLEVAALGGEPGVRSARYATDGHDFEANNRLLLQNLSGKSDRKAQFRTIIALILDGTEYLFEGKVEGEITTEHSGIEGFGYDPLFIPNGEVRTFAEMSIEEKGRISHRGHAVRALVKFLSRANV